MGRRRRMRQEREDDDNDGTFPIQYLLPLQPPPALDDEDRYLTVSSEADGHDELDELHLYRQTVPLLHPQSTSAARTLGKMLGDNKIASRILQRNLPDNFPTPIPHAMRCLQFHKTCEELFCGFDPATTHTKTLPIHRMRLLLDHYGLHVDDVAYRRWEQSLPMDTSNVSLVAFIHGCTQWFPEQFLLDHYDAWRQQQQQHATVVPPALLGKCQSAPQLLHPFDMLARENDSALAFSYEDCAHSSPRLHKTIEEQRANKSQTLISTTQQLRRNIKNLTRLHPTSAIPSGSSPTRVATHDRLHDEKLARHILQRCGAQALAPSNRRKSSTAISLLTTPTNEPLTAHARRLKHHAATKLARQQNTETAKAFSASIAMISRHVHHEELRDLREIASEKQLAIVDERKHVRRVQHAHCQALAHEKSHQQMRDVAAMKTLAHEESELARQYQASREQLLRTQKLPFTLSSSSSTLFQEPPEILAAKATAKTTLQKKRLQLLEREHRDHMRSIQLIDYAYDKQRAVEDATEPKADATLVDVKIEQLPIAQETALATQELWQHIVENCEATGDLTPLLPPPNVPPAALRYFAAHRSTGVLLPPFTVSTVTPQPLSKVP